MRKRHPVGSKLSSNKPTTPCLETAEKIHKEILYLPDQCRFFVHITTLVSVGVKGCYFQSEEYGFACGRVYSFTFNKIFSGRQPRQRVKVLQLFRDWFRPWNAGELSLLLLVYLPQKIVLNYVAVKASRPASSSFILFYIYVLLLYAKWDHLGDPGVDWRIILRWIFRKWDVKVWTVSSWLRTGTGGGPLWLR